MPCHWLGRFAKALALPMVAGIFTHGPATVCAGGARDLAGQFSEIGLHKLDGLPEDGWLQPLAAVAIQVDPKTAFTMARNGGRETLPVHPVSGSAEGEFFITRTVWVGTGTDVGSYGPELRGALAVSVVAAPANFEQEAAEMRARVVAAREAGALALVVARPDASSPDWSRLGAAGAGAAESGTRGQSVSATLGAGASPLGLPVVFAGGAMLRALAPDGDVDRLLASPAPSIFPFEGILRVAFKRKEQAQANVLGYLAGAGARFRDEIIVIAAPIEGPAKRVLLASAKSFASGTRKAARSLLFAGLHDATPGSASVAAVSELPARIVSVVDLRAARGIAVAEVNLTLSPGDGRLAELAARMAASSGITLRTSTDAAGAAGTGTDIARLSLEFGDSSQAGTAALEFITAMLEQLSATPLSATVAKAETVGTAAPTPPPTPSVKPGPAVSAGMAVGSATGVPARAEATPEPSREPAPGDTLRDRRERHLRNVRQLTFGGENAEAYWSLDGKQLILQATRKPLSCDQIFVHEMATGKSRMVSTGKGRTTCAWFFPAGDRILYASTHLSGEDCPPPPDRSKGYVWSLDDFDIFTARPDGSDLKRITWNPRYDAEATMSEDGKRIVFTTVRDGDLEIYTMNPDGTDATRLTRTLGYDGGPVFSPDGTQIVYRAHHPKLPADITRYQELLDASLVEPRALEIRIMNSDGSNSREITHNGAANFAPCWTRDGRRILFSSNLDDPRGRNFDLYLVGADGSGIERVTFDATFDGFPMFSPDGRTLVWASNRNSAVRGETNIFIADWVE